MIIGSVIKPVIGSVIGNVLKKTGVSYDYLITDDETWTSTFALGAATLSGKTIAVAPGSYTSKTISSFNPASTVTIKALNAGSKPVIDRLTLSNVSKINAHDLKLVSSYWAADATSNGCLQFASTVSDIAIRRCEFIGNYRGTVDFALDPTIDTYPEYACIRPVFNDSGVVTSLEILRSNVGDLVADGTHSLTFSNYSSVTFTVSPVATMTVSGGVITGTTLTSGGSSNGTSATGASIRTNLVSWAGQRKMTLWMPSAWRCTGGSSITGNIIFEDCSIKLCNHGFKPTFVQSSATITVRRCSFDLIYQDFMSFSGHHAITITDCLGTRLFSFLDAGDPHADFIQLFWAGQTSDWGNIEIERNIFVSGNARGSLQGILLGDPTSGYYYDSPRIVGNAILNTNASLGMDFETIKNGYIYRNLAARFDPTDTVKNTAAVGLTITGETPSGTPFFGDNIGETVSVSSSGYPSVALGLRGATRSYASVFANPTGTRVTRSEIVAAYLPIGDAAGKGPFANSSYIDHAAYTTDRSLEPTWVAFASVSGQTVSSTSTSNWSKVQGGVDGRAISISNGEYRIADDASGTNATSWGSSASTVNVGKFVQVRHTTSASGSTTVTSTLTIGGYAFTFQSTTASSASFVTIDNGGTAYSSVARPTNETTLRKFVMAVRFNADAITTNANILAHTAASVMRLWFPTTTAVRLQLLASTRVRLIPVHTPVVGQARTHIITLDFTNTNAGQGCQWATDVDGVLLNNNAGSGGTFDTRSVAGSGTDYGACTFDLTSSAGIFGSSGSWGVFGEADGGGLLFDGKIDFLWADWGGAGYTLPDITNATIRNRWTADLIGANGQGPTGSTPKIYYTGNAAGWNAGLANLGTLTLPLTKQAGTYV
jgi:hypothetical protein